jgi:hypothetical protein
MNPRVVLYTPDFEPITVITLPPFALAYLQEHHTVRLAAPIPCDFVASSEDISRHWERMQMHIVEIRAERLVRQGKEHLMLFTKDETAAMLLRADFLPGQRREVQEMEREQYARGFMDALTAACRGMR